MYRQGKAGAFQLLRELAAIVQRMDLLGNMQGRLIPCKFHRGIPKDQNWKGHIPPAQLQCLFIVGNCQITGPQLLKLPCHRNRPMAVGIRFYNPQKAAALRHVP